MGWFELSLASMALYGIQAFLFKAAARRGCDSSLLMFFFMMTAGGFASAAYLLNPAPISGMGPLLLYAISQAIFYLFRQMSKIEAMKLIPGAVALPLAATQGMVAAILGISLLREEITSFQLLGIISALLVILIFSREGGGEAGPRDAGRGIALAISAAVSGGVVNFILKLAATISNHFLFIAVSYYFALLPSYLYYRLKGASRNMRKESAKFGICSGIVNFIAFALFLSALAQGPVSIITPLVDLNLIFAVIIIAIVYREKLTNSRIFGVLLAIAAVFLLK
ncbi:MAG: DMT family transporter [Candidatus Bathyarchaeia archaeon]